MKEWKTGLSMPIRPLLLALLVTGTAVCLGRPCAAAGQPGTQRPEVVWDVELRNHRFEGWRQRLAVGGDGSLWLGGDVVLSEEGGGLLYRRQRGRWSSRIVLPPENQRTFALDIDSEGGLWLAPYHPENDDRHPRSPYRHELRIQHFDGRRWREESAPGFWPQSMDMISPEEGWIGGNHGQFLHRSGGRWRLETIPVDTSILGLRMLNVEEGWAAGASGLVARFQRGAWHVLQVPAALARKNFFDLDVTEDGALWLVGSNGLIVRYDGRSWQLFRTAEFDLKGIDMVSPSDGWAVGDHGTLLRYDGTAWAPQPDPIPGINLLDVVMTSGGEGWISGDQIVLRARATSAAWQAPRFQDQSRWGGYPMARTPAERAAVLDADRDGDLDLATVGEDGVRLFLQAGPRRFSEAPSLPALTASPREIPALYAWAWGDTEGDGDLDLVLWGRPFGLRHLQNTGRGLFPTAERLRSGGLSSLEDILFALDLDRDGKMDLYLVRGQSPPYWIYRNQGDGRFQRSLHVPSGPGVKPLWNMTAVWGDLDGDRDLDAVFSGGGAGTAVLLNDGKGRFETTGGDLGAEIPVPWDRTNQALLVDLDLDGDLDLVLQGNRLLAFLNDGKAHFRRAPALVPPLASTAFAGSFLAAGDLDHDGYAELLVKTVQDSRHVLRLLARDPKSGVYRDVTQGSGLEGLAGNGAVFADLDGDGDLDLFLVRSEGSLVLENSQNDRSFLKVHLHGDRGNRQAVGAQVWIYDAGGRPGRRLRGYQQLGVGFSTTGQQNLSELHFGLDERRRYDLEVLFPDGRRVVERGLRTGRTVEIFESPPGLRQGWLMLHWAQRSWLAANGPLEAGKLAAVVLALLLWRGPLARRLQARLFVPRWSLAAALLTTYLLVAAEHAGARRAAPHAAQLLGLCAVLALLAGLDAWLGRWKNRRFLGPFVLEKTLGQGGMGIVYRARHALTGQTAALKVLHPQWMDREDLRLRFLREAQALTRLSHPNIVRVFETGAVGDRGYISMELLRGMPLSHYLRQAGPLEPEIVVELLLAACGALVHVHAGGLVHGDVKSANLFLLEPDDLAPAVAQGWRPRIKLMDFGLAQRLGAEPLLHPVLRPASLDGTPAYMAPEQLQGRPLDARSDLYSLGVVAYEALTGRLPFEDEAGASLLWRIQTGDLVPVRQRRPGIPAGCERLLARLLAVSPDDRPASADELAALLRALRRNGDPGEVPALPPAVPVAPVEAVEAVEAAGLVSWQSLLRDARARLAQGRTTEGQILLMECIAALGEVLHPLSAPERDAYCRQHEEIAAALDLHRRLSERLEIRP
jgi:serine/threonine-protein kinase